MREIFRSKIQFNKLLILRLTAIFLISQILFCASAKQYLANRGNDLKDIPILGLEANVYGFNTVILLPAIGVAYNKNGKGIGIRHSHMGKYRVGDPDNKFTLMNWYRDSDEYDTYFGNPFPMGNSFHEPLNNNSLRVSNKTYRVFTGNRCGRKLTFHYKNTIDYCHYYENVEFYPVELSMGMFFGVRVGFSAGELADFLVGFIGFDPLDDDISKTEPIYHDLPLPLTEKKDWESKLDALDEKMNKRLKK